MWEGGEKQEEAVERHCMLSFMWNLDLPRVTVEKERARGQ